MRKLLTVTTSLCVLTVAWARGQTAQKPQMAEEAFKNTTWN
jgi:hypothetical protein